MTRPLTRKQQDVLDLITQSSPSAISNAELSITLGLPREGTAQTAASLVRRGLAERRYVHTLHGRIVGYILAPGA